MRRQSSEGLTKAGGSFSKMTYLGGWQVGTGCWQENTVHHRPLLRTAEVSSKSAPRPPRPPPTPEQMIKIEAGAPVFSRI